MAPNGNIRWPHTALLAGTTSGPERQYRWPPQAQILILIGVLGNLPFIIGIGLLCSVFDLIYIGMLWSAKKNPAAFAAARVEPAGVVTTQ